MDEVSKKNSFTLKLDYRVIIVVLLVVIAGMLAVWRPWVVTGERTVDVTGQATVTAEPDEFVFYPSYQFTGADKTALLSSLGAKSDEIVSKLKELGVADSKIKANSGGYDYPVYKDNTSTPTYTLSFTVTVDNKELAQKVQDYLVTTSPTGSVSPQATFSDAKQKELESKARDEASKDARAKAEQSAKNLGFSVGAVKTVNDSGGFGTVFPMYANDLQSADASSGKLTVQPGENDLIYTVTVTYFVN
jgi:uncharacterized protein YggE